MRAVTTDFYLLYSGSGDNTEETRSDMRNKNQGIREQPRSLADAFHAFFLQIALSHGGRVLEADSLHSALSFLVLGLTRQPWESGHLAAGSQGAGQRRGVRGGPRSISYKLIIVRL